MFVSNSFDNLQSLPSLPDLQISKKFKKRIDTIVKSSTDTKPIHSHFAETAGKILDLAKKYPSKQKFLEHYRKEIPMHDRAFFGHAKNRFYITTEKAAQEVLVRATAVFLGKISGANFTSEDLESALGHLQNSRELHLDDAMYTAGSLLTRALNEGKAEDLQGMTFYSLRFDNEECDIPRGIKVVGAVASNRSKISIYHGDITAIEGSVITAKGPDASVNAAGANTCAYVDAHDAFGEASFPGSKVIALQSNAVVSARVAGAEALAQARNSYAIQGHPDADAKADNGIVLPYEVPFDSAQPKAFIQRYRLNSEQLKKQQEWGSTRGWLSNDQIKICFDGVENLTSLSPLGQNHQTEWWALEGDSAPGQPSVFYLVSLDTLLGMADQNRGLINPFTNCEISERKQILTGEQLLEWFEEADLVQTSSELAREENNPAGALVPPGLFSSEPSQPPLQLIPRKTVTFGVPFGMGSLDISAAKEDDWGDQTLNLGGVSSSSNKASSSADKIGAFDLTNQASSESNYSETASLLPKEAVSIEVY